MQLRRIPAALIVLAACAPKPDAAPPAGPQEVVFIASEFAFAGPDSIAPGLTAIRLVNRGAQPHHLILGRLAEGKSLQDLRTFMDANPASEPPFLIWLGAAGTIQGGDSTGSTADLQPGRYVLICFMPDPADQKEHAVKGMLKELVVSGTPHSAPAPATTGEIRMRDYGYSIPAFTPGTQTLHVFNEGPKTHEVQLIRLNDGATAKTFLAALAPGATSPPPGTMVGGPGALSSGLDTYWTVNLTPGNYLILCFVPDEGDNVPHVMKGMVTEFSIPAT